MEAIRMYAADHDGRLPDSLNDITKVPVPADPVRGEEFVYQVVEGKAVLEGPAPPGESPSEGIRYELTLKQP